MIQANTSSLFHFTGKMEYLKDILSKGFRYSYSFESYNESIIRNDNPDIQNKTFFFPCKCIKNGVAIPMICFCDIPLTRTASHRKVYNNYAIGINKEMAISIYGSILNPINYMSSTHSYLSLADLSVVKTTVFPGCHNLKTSINYLIAMSKPYSGCVLDDWVRCFYDEREWRIFLPDDKDTPYQWHWNIDFPTREKFKEWREPYNEALEKSELGRLSMVNKKTLSDTEEKELISFFTHIIVEKEDEVAELVDYILDGSIPIFGYKYIKKTSRQLLATKITSVERIEKDY